jgi:two-component system OmpR family response regulator
MPRVLIIDDDSATQTLFTAVLRHHGVECLVVGDGEVALSELRRKRFDAIILDLMMPKVNGFEVLRELKCTAPDVPRVIVCSAMNEAKLHGCEELSRVRAFLAKPVDIGEFAEAVLQMLGPVGVAMQPAKVRRDLAAIVPLRDVS